MKRSIDTGKIIQQYLNNPVRPSENARLDEGLGAYPDPDPYQNDDTVKLILFVGT